MRKIFIISVLFLISCSKTFKKDIEKQKFKEYPVATDIQLNFLDEFVYPPNQKLKNTEIGGLSGIDYTNGKYTLICDNPSNPRYYEANINIKNNKITNVVFDKVVLLKDYKNDFFKTHLDLESIVCFDDETLFSSEGSISRNVNPSIFGININGKMSKVTLKKRFLIEGEQRPRNNGVFEGVSRAFDNNGFWVATELPLILDGTPSKYAKTKSPVRFTYYDKNKNAVKEFVYELSALSREPKGLLNINGLTAILEYKKNHFLVLERCYQRDYVGDENVVKIYKATIDENTTDVFNQEKLTSYTPMKKELVLDLHSIKSKLTSNIIDNLEGITFGQKLANGKQSVILISDDNFRKYGDQINQFLLFEIDFK